MARAQHPSCQVFQIRVGEPLTARVAERRIDPKCKIPKVDLLYWCHRQRRTMMTPQEEQAVREVWAAKRKMKSYARIARMKEREKFKMIPPSNRRWCTNTCQWYDDRKVT